MTAKRLINRYGAIEDFPPEVLAGERRELALLFKRLATLRTDAALFADVEALRWRSPTESFDAWRRRSAMRACARAAAARRPLLHEASRPSPANRARSRRTGPVHLLICARARRCQQPPNCLAGVIPLNPEYQPLYKAARRKRDD